LNPIKRLAGQTAIYGLSSIIGRLLNYLLIPIYTRVFIPSEYGIVGELYAYVALFAVILTYGLETAYFRYVKLEKDPALVYSTSLISLVATSVIAVLFGILYHQGIAERLGYGTHSEYILYFVLIICIDAVTAIPFARLRQENRPVRFATVKLINIASNILLNLYYILFCPYLLTHYADAGWAKLFLSIYNPSVGVGYIFISNLISTVVTLVLLLPQLTNIPWKINPKLWRTMMGYALPLLVMGLAGSINESFDRILLKHLLPDKSTAMAQLGIYSACYKISILMTIFIQTFRYAADPFFFGEADKQDSKKTYARVMNYFIIICAFIFLATMLYMDIVKHFVGRQYYSGLPIVPILLLANLFLGVYYNLSFWYKLTNKTMYGAYISLFGAFLTLLLNFWLIPVIGYMGSAWATFICYASMMII
jgi:O-antigen/teichoic acid export membrane protein